jgi:transposase-like protein
MNDTIMKTDRRGRLRYTPEQRATLIEAYQSSGLSGPRFAAIHGVNYQTLASWLLKRKRAASSAYYATEK